MFVLLLYVFYVFLITVVANGFANFCVDVLTDCVMFCAIIVCNCLIQILLFVDYVC